MEKKKIRYVLLLRGINVGGKNKVSMKGLKAAINEVGYQNIITYINSGNIIFDTDDDLQSVNEKMAEVLSTFSFPIRYVIMTREEYLDEAASLPNWWGEPFARKDVLFCTDEVDWEQMKARIDEMPLYDEFVHFGKRVVFWGKYTEKEYLRTSYHKLLLKESFYPLITIRNERTFNKLKEILE